MARLLVVTGGTRGIGRAVAERFAAAGFDICTCGRREGSLHELKGAITAKYKAQVFTLVADMSVKAQVRNFTDYVAGLNRPVNVLVNNAGYFLPGEVTSEPEGTLESMINSNLYSAYYTTRGLVDALRKSDQGHVFNMCSIASIKAYPNGGSYAISKFALLGFTKVLREELKESGVRVTAVLPGATRTDSWEGTTLPEERFIRSEDVAESIFSANALSARSVVEEILIRPQLGDI
jgi:short-subunit dehydrogenase